LYELARKSGYSVEISWIGHGPAGEYDVAFWRQQTAMGTGATKVSFEAVDVERPHANHPTAGKLMRLVVPQLRCFLQAKLPDYMVPAALVLIEKLPLTANGKIDKDSLPLPELTRTGAAEKYVKPRTDVEKRLAAIWSEVLGVAQIGIHDDFFEAGGHSLLATQVVSRVRHEFGVELPLRHLFESPTIAGISQILGWVLKERETILETDSPQEEGRI
jgi:acyl carrier protein